MAATANTPWYQNPEIIRALIGAGGAGLETFSQYQQSKGNREQQQQLSRAGTLQSLYEGDQGEDFLRERTALDAFQQNPYAQLEADQRQAIRAALLGDISNVTGSFDPSSGTGRLSGGVNLANIQRPDVQNFFSPEARLGARSEFDTIRASVAPNVPIGMGPAGPSGSYIGFGEPGLEAAQRISEFGQNRFADLQSRRDMERDAIMRALEGDIAGQKDKEKKGGGFWKKLAKVGLIAGGGIATAMTGGAASPLLAAAIGAGTGAASGALDGGWKGALTGGTLGGVTGGLLSGAGGAASSGIRQGLGQAARSTFTDPRMLLQMGGAGVGGPVGTALQLGSNFIPRGRPALPGMTPRQPDFRLGQSPLQAPSASPTFNPYGPGRNPYDNINFGRR
jgi:hypothetical protein